MPYLQPEQGPTLYYEEKGAGRPLLLVHDWGTNLRVWDGIVGELATEFRVISFDLRGHGSSEVTNTTHGVDAFADDIAAITEGLMLSDATIVGWSMGGQAGMRYLARGGMRASKLALVGTMPFYLDISPYATNWTQDFIREIGEMAALPRPLFVRRFFDLYFSTEVSTEVIDWLAQMALATPAWVTFECSASLFATDLRPVLGSLATPTLLMHGRRDRMCAYDASILMAETMPDARMTTFELAGHSPHLEERETFVASLSTFVRAS